jgi:hypothetical protein
MPVRMLCRYAIERDEILINPTTNLRLPVANGRRERVASPQEAAELIEALPEDSAASGGRPRSRGYAAASSARCAGATSTSART